MTSMLIARANKLAEVLAAESSSSSSVESSSPSVSVAHETSMSKSANHSLSSALPTAHLITLQEVVSSPQVLGSQEANSPYPGSVESSQAMEYATHYFSVEESSGQSLVVITA